MHILILLVILLSAIASFSPWSHSAMASSDEVLPVKEITGYPYFLARAKPKPKKDPKLMLKQPPKHERVKSIIPHGNGIVTIISDRQERTPDGIYVAEGDVDITYQDMQLQADYVTYDTNTQDSFARGNCVFKQGEQYFHSTEGEYNFETKTGKFYSVDGYTDQEFLIKAVEIDKKSEEKYDVEKGFLTACREATPLWSITSSKTNITVNKHAFMHNAILRIKNIPLLYLPFLILPLEKKERQSGIIMPSFGSSNSKGKFIHSAFYLTLGESADATFLGDYFSKRGGGYGLKFRARPSDQAWLNVATYYVNDRLGAGGGDILLNGTAPLKYGFRIVADVNYVTNFKFRQVFADTFRSATNTFENSNIFITKSFDAFSAKAFFSRQVTFFPTHPFVIHNGPSFEFRSLGKQIGSLGTYPFRFYLDSGVENMTRRDGVSSTELTRWDFFPRISVPFHTFAGLSLTPTIGFRDTLYTDSLQVGSLSQSSGHRLNRHYMAFELASRGPGFYRVFTDREGNARFKHTIEPEITYRRISGIKDFDRIIRFDDRDVISDTNEVEYALVNRFFVKRVQPGSTSAKSFEFLSFKLSQKYYFDPTFGNVLFPGQVNTILPVNTLSAYPFFSNGRRRTSPINTQIRINPSPNYSVDIRTDYDAYWKRWRDASVTGFFRANQLFYSGSYLVTNAIVAEPSTFKSNQLQSQIGYGNPLKGFATGIIISYDIGRALLLYSGWRFHLNSDCCGTTFEIRQFNLGFRSETQFRFSFMFKGLGHFGNLRNPESLF